MTEAAGGQQSSLPFITEVEVEDGMIVRLAFRDGTEFSVDLEPYMEGLMLEEVLESGQFAKVRVDQEFGGLEWPNGADIAPEALYDPQP